MSVILRVRQRAPKAKKPKAPARRLPPWAWLPGLLAFLAPSLLGPGAWAYRDPNNLVVSGSTTTLPITQAAAEGYLATRPDLRLSVSGTGTGEGLKSLIDGLVDVAGASRDILPAEAKRALDKGVRLQRHALARDSLAVVTHPDNPISDLSLDDLYRIYVGEIRNWKELGGEDRPIVAINRDSSSGTFEMWLTLVLRGARYRRDAQTQPSGGGVAYAVGGNRNAIGYVGLGFLNERVKALKIGGIGPDLQNVASGAYPLSRELYLFTQDPHSGIAQDFLNYLQGPAGREIISREGFLPPPAP